MHENFEQRQSLSPDILSHPHVMVYDQIFSPAFAVPKFVDYKRSLSVAKLVKAHSKQACKNALRALLEHIGTGMYVEGRVVDTSRLPYVSEHAWVLTDHTIVDPTPGFQKPTRDVAYFDVHMWSVEDLLKTLERQKVITLPIARTLPAAGKESAHHRSALIEAHRHRAAVHLRDSGMPFFATEHEDRFVRTLTGDRWPRGGGEAEGLGRRG